LVFFVGINQSDQLISKRGVGISVTKHVEIDGLVFNRVDTIMINEFQLWRDGWRLVPFSLALD
jgi:hypothetical protein